MPNEVRYVATWVAIVEVCVETGFRCLVVGADFGRCRADGGAGIREGIGGDPAEVRLAVTQSVDVMAFCAVFP